jgi:uncharacterized protein
MLKPAPLTSEELKELNSFLLGIEGAMDLETVDGFLAAIVCSPTVILPSEWLRWVWDMKKGEAMPDFNDYAEALRITKLLVRHMNDISQTLLEVPEKYKPQLLYSQYRGEMVPFIDDWCAGFMKGVELDAEGWRAVTANKPDWLSTIKLYGTADGRVEFEKKNLSLDEHKVLVAGLADTVRNIHAVWRGRRREQMAERTMSDFVRRLPVRNPDKVGRNDPCPCGSGKKFKRCHGGAERMH